MPRFTDGLTRDFAEWMRSELGYKSIQSKSVAWVAAGKRERIADLRGESYEQRWWVLRVSGIVVVAFLIALENAPAAITNRLNPRLMTGSMLGAVAAVVLARLGRSRTAQYVWVQCGQWARPVRESEVRNLWVSIEEVRRSRSAKWKPTEVIIASGERGFDVAATEEAKRLAIRCYKRTDSGFERVA